MWSMRRLCLWLVSTIADSAVIPVAYAANDTQAPNSTIPGAFPQLTNLKRSIASQYSLSIGAQDFGHCCLLAVNDSLSVVDNAITGFSPVRVQGQDFNFMSDDYTTFRYKQFPCGANYIGDKQGAPKVTIPYSYCRANCPGWQRSKNSVLNQWVSPFVGFLVPAVVFCLAIPRR